jgi:hypothetical protein
VRPGHSLHNQILYAVQSLISEGGSKPASKMGWRRQKPSLDSNSKSGRDGADSQTLLPNSFYMLTLYPLGWSKIRLSYGVRTLTR